MADYEQMEIDVRLESEKDLKTNVGKVISSFTTSAGWKPRKAAGRLSR